MADIKGIELASDIYGLEDETARDNTETNTSAIGTLVNLQTTAKANLVAAINEVNEKSDDNASSIETLSTYGMKTLWSGNATKGDVINFSSQGYDLLFAKVRRTLLPCVSNPRGSSGIHHKFTGIWAGRDTANGEFYNQTYVLDILADGTVATCAWINNPISGSAVDENSVTVTEIFGIKFKPIV